MRKFLWKCADDREGSHLVPWDLITKPKDVGDLGLDKIKVANDALIGKWIWRYYKEPNQLWRLLIDSKYSTLFPGSTPSKCKYINAKSPGFNIVKLENNIGSHILWKVRNGVGTLFWFHKWTSEILLYLQLPRLFNLAVDPHITGRDAWNTAYNSWNPNFRHPLLDRELQS